MARLITELIEFLILIVGLAGLPSWAIIAFLRVIKPERWPTFWLALLLLCSVWVIVGMVTGYWLGEFVVGARARNDHYMIWVIYVPWLVLCGPAIPTLVALLRKQPEATGPK